jgi:hypothetical protein
LNEPAPNPETRIALFQHKEIRRTIHNNEWWFVITDVVGALTDSADPSDYLKKMRKRDPELAVVLQGGGQFVPPLGLEFDTAGGRQKRQCWNTVGILRLERPQSCHQRELPRPDPVREESEIAGQARSSKEACPMKSAAHSTLRTCKRQLPEALKNDLRAMFPRRRLSGGI